MSEFLRNPRPTILIAPGISDFHFVLPADGGNKLRIRPNRNRYLSIELAFRQCLLELLDAFIGDFSVPQNEMLEIL